MSADPNDPTWGNRLSAGRVVRTPFYSKDGSELKLNMDHETNPRIADQKTIAPYDPFMDYCHPCFDLNEALDKCSESQPNEMRLNGRVAACNEQRKAMMQCMVKNKKWRAPKREWYEFWK